MELLSLEGYVSLQRAQRLVSEMEEGVFDKGIEKEISDGPRAVIEIGQSPVRLYEPVQCRASYRKPEYDSSTARNEFTYEWDFGDGLQEKGLAWTVRHFYKDHKKDPYPVKVTIFSLKEGKVVSTLTEQIQVETETSKIFSIDRRDRHIPDGIYCEWDQRHANRVARDFGQQCDARQSGKSGATHSTNLSFLS
jgi:hypothetical protein